MLKAIIFFASLFLCFNFLSISTNNYIQSWKRDLALEDPRGQILWPWSWPWPRALDSLALALASRVLAMALRVHALALALEFWP